ncbi:hypothetical protein HNR19_000476 [Nocardioides thalensis]|uniref:Uncharacterized protein n=1 Tax=Nocardioides thalensis TaxID=1914755 RepID=A0A853BZH8_9ACTN|nr:hypothetical protein [Nocardioides thalensis]NYI99777.1 hypothetical protein [Nocardioides thalensis]
MTEKSPGPEKDPEKESDWQRRKRLAEIFGDVLPETTRDERDADKGDRGDESASDRWLKSQVPPHHG